MRLGPYEVVAPVGAGGMGEVYRARDTKLNRDVAIKILPDAFASDPERLTRFEREARTLASLNHPNIAQIYGVEAGAGGAGSTRALVMEFVEGNTLEEIISGAGSRGIDIETALAVARQIADALEAAHERGIVHRDLKPANVKIAGDGTVKVLDFGLAKAVDSPDGDVMNSPTFTSPATELGVILGTAAYMAPEQARGKAVDKRADIWAFGCVVYEMLTGRRAFVGDSTAELLSAVISQEPDLSALPASVPLPVTRLLRRCLVKDPKLRLRDIGEARIALSDGAQISKPDMIVGEARQRRWSWRATAALLTAVAGAGGFALGRDRTPPGGQMLTSFAQITDQPGLERQPTISPDGKSVVFVSAGRGNEDLYLMRVGGRRAVLLTEDSEADDYAPAFSPDGNQIAFRSERGGGGIFVMDATGESVRRLADAGFDPRWSPDGTELVVAEEAVTDPMSRNGDSRLWVIKLADGTRRLAAQADAVGGRWSPNGRRIAYWGLTSTSSRDIWTVPSDGSGSSSPVNVTTDDAVDWGPAWSPDGRFLYFSSSRGGTMNLWRVRIDQESGRTLGEPEPITTPTAWSGNIEFAADGERLVFADQDERSTIWAVDFDPIRGVIAGAPRAILQGRAINSVDLSPDGSRVVFSQRLQPWEALGVVGIDGSGWSRLTDDDFYHRAPNWSPDGRRILFYSNRSHSRMFTLLPDGSGLRELPVPPRFAGSAYPIWSPDESRLALAADDGAVILDTSASPMTLVKHVPRKADEFGFLPFSWSPDGRSIAGTSRFSPTRDRLVFLDVGSASVRTLAEDGKSPVWMPDSRRLLFSSRTSIMLLDASTGESRAVLPLERNVLQWGRLLSLSKDGRKLVYLSTQTEGDVWMMSLDTLSPGDMAAK
jgi:Tol biopolymer transport system component